MGRNIALLGTWLILQYKKCKEKCLFCKVMLTSKPNPAFLTMPFWCSDAAAVPGLATEGSCPQLKIRLSTHGTVDQSRIKLIFFKK